MLFHKLFFAVAILFSICPNRAAAQLKRQEPSAAIESLVKAAEQGDAKAQFELASAYDGGRGVRQDFLEAFKWYRRAAEQGNASAQYSLGYMYAESRGVAQDDEEAMKWFRKAADRGHSDAQLALGLRYDEGRGVTQDYVKASEWFQKAADQGNPMAQFRLGRMYAEGRGVTQDYVQAYKWFDLSALRSVPPKRPEVAGWRNMVARMMTPQQIEEAQKLVKESDMYFVGEALTQPVVLNQPRPPYTDEARQARVSGMILLQCVIQKDGSVGSCRVLRRLGYGLDESAVNTITSQWRFKPGTFQGKPRDVQAEISVEFRIPQRQ